MEVRVPGSWGVGVYPGQGGWSTQDRGLEYPGQGGWSTQDGGVRVPRTGGLEYPGQGGEG